MVSGPRWRLLRGVEIQQWSSAAGLRQVHPPQGQQTRPPRKANNATRGSAPEMWRGRGSGGSQGGSPAVTLLPTQRRPRRQHLLLLLRGRTLQLAGLLPHLHLQQ